MPRQIDRTPPLAYLTLMSILPIITVPDPILREASSPVERVDDDVRRLMDDMLETMYDAPGIGLAAIQVAVPRRVVVIDTSDKDEERKPLFLVNPRIVHRSDALRTYEEGCLSLPDILVEIERPAEIRVDYIDRDGKAQTIEASGITATALQHEIDHLDGKLIIDFLSKLRRDMVVRKLKKLARSA